jgi:hypothetical protein
MSKNIIFVHVSERSWGSSVGITTGYGLDSRDSIPGRGKKFFSSPQRPLVLVFTQFHI